jgi:type III secretion protein J
VRPLVRSALLVAALLVSGCAAPVAAGLDEGDANAIVVALDRASVDSTKEVDPGVEGKFRVLVAHDDVARALVTLNGEELPRAKPTNVLDAVGKGALVPSEMAEHAELVAGLEGELEKTLQGVEGVLSARVHLNVAEADPLNDRGIRPRSTASVLLAHRGSTPPISTDDVQRLVAGGVPGLLPNDVAVVTVSRAATPAVAPASALGHVGPLAVARSSMRAVQAVLGGFVLLVAVLATLTLLLYSRLGRARAELLARPAPSPRA